MLPAGFTSLLWFKWLFVVFSPYEFMHLILSDYGDPAFLLGVVRNMVFSFARNNTVSRYDIGLPRSGGTLYMQWSHANLLLPYHNDVSCSNRGTVERWYARHISPSAYDHNHHDFRRSNRLQQCDRASTRIEAVSRYRCRADCNSTLLFSQTYRSVALREVCHASRDHPPISEYFADFSGFASVTVVMVAAVVVYEYHQIDTTKVHVVTRQVHLYTFVDSSSYLCNCFQVVRNRTRYAPPHPAPPSPLVSY